MGRRFRNATPRTQSFYLKRRMGVHGFATHVKAGQLIEARDEEESRFLAGFVKRGVLIEVEPGATIDTKPPVRKTTGPRRFLNSGRCMQRFNPPWKSRSWADNIDLQPGEIVVAQTDEEAEFWTRCCAPKGPLVEIE